MVLELTLRIYRQAPLGKLPVQLKCKQILVKSPQKLVYIPRRIRKNFFKGISNVTMDSVCVKVLLWGAVVGIYLLLAS